MSTFLVYIQQFLPQYEELKKSADNGKKLSAKDSNFVNTFEMFNAASQQLQNEMQKGILKLTAPSNDPKMRNTTEKIIPFGENAKQNQDLSESENFRRKIRDLFKEWRVKNFGELSGEPIPAELRGKAHFLANAISDGMIDSKEAYENMQKMLLGNDEEKSAANKFYENVYKNRNTKIKSDYENAVADGVYKKIIAKFPELDSDFQKAYEEIENGNIESGKKILDEFVNGGEEYQAQKALYSLGVKLDKKHGKEINSALTLGITNKWGEVSDKITQIKRDANDKKISYAEAYKKTAQLLKDAGLEEGLSNEEVEREVLRNSSAEISRLRREHDYKKYPLSNNLKKQFDKIITRFNNQTISPKAALEKIRKIFEYAKNEKSDSEKNISEQVEDKTKKPQVLDGTSPNLNVTTLKTASTKDDSTESKGNTEIKYPAELNIKGERADKIYKRRKGMSDSQEKSFDENMSKAVEFGGKKITRGKFIEKIAEGEIPESEVKLNKGEREYLQFLKEEIIEPLQAIQRAGLSKVRSAKKYNFTPSYSFDGNKAIFESSVELDKETEFAKDDSAMENLNKLAETLDGEFGKGSLEKDAFIFGDKKSSEIFSKAANLFTSNEHLKYFGEEYEENVSEEDEEENNLIKIAREEDEKNEYWQNKYNILKKAKLTNIKLPAGDFFSYARPFVFSPNPFLRLEGIKAYAMFSLHFPNQTAENYFTRLAKKTNGKIFRTDHETLFSIREELNFPKSSNFNSQPCFAFEKYEDAENFAAAAEMLMYRSRMAWDDELSKTEFDKKYGYIGYDDRETIKAILGNNKHYTENLTYENNSLLKIGEYEHTKTGELIPSVELTKKLPDEFTQLNSLAKRYGGKYSRFAKKFLFKTSEGRNKFVEEATATILKNKSSEEIKTESVDKESNSKSKQEILKAIEEDESGGAAVNAFYDDDILNTKKLDEDLESGKLDDFFEQNEVVTDKKGNLIEIRPRKTEIEKTPETKKADQNGGKDNSNIELAEGYRTESGRSLKDADSREFIIKPDGSKDFGRISKETVEKANEVLKDTSALGVQMKVAPVRLQVGDENFGYVHLIKRYLPQIQSKGFDNAASYIDYTLNNFNQIYDQSFSHKKSGKLIKRFVLYSKGDSSKGFMPVDLELENDGGEYYTIVSAMPHNEKIKGELIFDGSSRPSTVTADGSLIEDTNNKGGVVTSRANAKTNSPSENITHSAEIENKKLTNAEVEEIHNQKKKQWEEYESKPLIQKIKENGFNAELKIADRSGAVEITAKAKGGEELKFKIEVDKLKKAEDKEKFLSESILKSLRESRNSVWDNLSYKEQTTAQAIMKNSLSIFDAATQIHDDLKKRVPLLWTIVNKVDTNLENFF